MSKTINLKVMDEKLTILGIKIEDRMKEAGEVQKLLSRYGCSIKTRLGLHEVAGDYCSTSGLIILELAGPAEDQRKLHDELQKIQGVLVRKMEF
ncbi:MAG TPA: hypothetical protein PLX42_06560 [Tenuifilaceae bacterium]|nr:hypothetical protein [Tenuifilaceae bacterium]